MTLRKEIVSRNFGHAAAKYESTARLQLRVADELISQCQFTGQVLDLGAGPGILRKYSKWDVTELDLSFEMCKQSGGIAVNADIENLPFANEAFPNVVSSLSLQWTQDIEKALAEIHRVLKPGGKFAFTTFSPNSLKDLKAAFSYIDSDQHLMDFEPVMRIFAMLKKAGFSNLSVDSQIITYYFPDIISALRSIKDIGASYGFAANHKGLKTRKYFTKIENAYKSLIGSEDRIPLIWEVLYIHAEKSPNI